MGCLHQMRFCGLCLRSKYVDGINFSLSLKIGEDLCPSSKPSQQREWFLPYSPFCFVQPFNGLGDAHSHWQEQGEQFTLLSLPSQVWTSSTNTLTVTHNNGGSNTRVPLGSVKLTHDINTTVRSSWVFNIYSNKEF